MEIEIPSPSVFLRPDPVLRANVPTASENTRLVGPTRQCPNIKPKTTTSDASAQNDEITSLKQGKSRNGCITCKKKRLKCDETKPFCVQCKKRNTECGGYKKDYRWRSFEDTTKQSRAGKAKRLPKTSTQGDAPKQKLIEPVGRPTSSHSNEEPSWSPSLLGLSTSQTQAIVEGLPPTDRDDVTPPLLRFSHFQFDPLHIFNLDFSQSDDDFLSCLPASTSQPGRPYESDGRSSFSIGSPPSVNVLLPGNDLRNPPGSSTIRHPWSPLTGKPGLDQTSYPNDEDIGEEIGRYQTAASIPEMSGSPGMFRTSSTAESQRFPNSSLSPNITLLKAPPFDLSSPEMLVLRFHRETCGILSIKDGPSENPWRTLIWPLAKDSQALYHAILAMAALHGGTTQPQLKLTAIAHMTKSVSKLSAEMHKMSLDQILASALTLALGESWDDKISTGIHHLKGAKTLLNNALAQQKTNLQLGQLSREDAKRLKFLSNTYTYLFAISSLTSNEEHDDIDLHSIVHAVNKPTGNFEYEIDPLMGCATTLFPLLSKVGSLIQKIRRTSKNSLSIISEANELREQLLQWEPPDMNLLEQPEDPSSNPRHALHTAEAYRRAILLCLHSAITELCSEPSYEQAKGILTMLALTPLSSRTIIVQIFPLLAGSCEMVEPDDRQWVTQRWDAMMKRLAIVTVSSCWKIVKEVWRRRDQWVEMQARRAKPMMSRNISPGHFVHQEAKRNTNNADNFSEDSFFDSFPKSDDTSYSFYSRGLRSSFSSEASGNVAPRQPSVRNSRNHTDIDVSLRNGEIQYSVRGHLHWLGVMSDWNWEVFL